MLLKFPTDVLLHILSYLSFPDLRALLLTSHEVNHFITANESSVYHQAAVKHRFVSLESSLEDVVLAEAPQAGWLDGVRTWKDFCRRWIILERNWDGRGVVHEGGHHMAGDGVMYFKVDEEQKTIVSVSRSGGLAVTAMEDNRILWSLPKEYVHRTRCELQQGFLVFPSTHHGLEIWRRSADVQSDMMAGETHTTTPICEPSPAAALDFQFAAASATPSSLQDYGALRGQFVPHAYLGRPLVDVVRIIKLHFPVLALMSMQDRSAVLLFDVRSGALLQRVAFDRLRPIGVPQGFELPPVSERVVMDIDVSDSHVAVCLHSVVAVVPWKDVAESEEQEAMIVAEIDTPQILQEIALQLSKRAQPVRDEGGKPSPCDTAHDHKVACVAGADALEQLDIIEPQQTTNSDSQALIHIGANRVPPCFVSARFSPDGKHLACVTVFGLLYLIPNFARVQKGGLSFPDILTRVYMGEWLRDLVWDEAQPRRLAIKAASEDIFIVNLDTTYHCTLDERTLTESDPFAGLRIFRLSDFSSPTLGWARERGVAFNGVQMTRTAVWVVWDVALLREAIRLREGREEKEWLEPPSGNGSLCFASFDMMV